MVTFQTHFSDHREFLPKYVHFNGQNLRDVLSRLSFWVKNAKIDFLKKGFECSFYRIEMQVVTKWCSRLEKHQTLETLLRVNFLHIF